MAFTPLNLCRRPNFFLVDTKLYNILSASPQRWSILQENIECSLHSISQTSWSARVNSVKPFAAHMPGLIKAINEIKLLNLSGGYWNVHENV